MSLCQTDNSHLGASFYYILYVNYEGFIWKNTFEYMKYWKYEKNMTLWVCEHRTTYRKLFECAAHRFCYNGLLTKHTWQYNGMMMWIIANLLYISIFYPKKIRYSEILLDSHIRDCLSIGLFSMRWSVFMFQ